MRKIRYLRYKISESAQSPKLVMTLILPAARQKVKEACTVPRSTYIFVEDAAGQWSLSGSGDGHGWEHTCTLNGPSGESSDCEDMPVS